MSDQLPNRESQPQVREGVRSGAWVGGAILIALGLIFLIQNVTGKSIDNWWAIFILFPAVSMFERGIRTYQADGRLSSRARSALFGGLLLAAVAVIFLLGGFGSWWPVFLILAGLIMLVNGLLPD